ncbi:MAG: hypothetical protein ACRC6T_06645 [Sarcina sp.]
MKKILIVSSAPIESKESASLRKISNIKSLISLGYEVSVLSVAPVMGSANYNDVYIEKLKRIYIKPRGIHSAGVTKKKSVLKNFARHIYYKCRIYDSMKGYSSKVNEVISELENFYDYIISISDPKSSHLLAINLIDLKCVKYKKYIQIWGDPMSLDITKNTIIPNYIIKNEEKKILSRADKIYYVSPLTLVKQKELFSFFEEKMDVIYPGYEKKCFYKLNDKILNIGYFGDYNSKIRNIVPLYESMKNTEFNLYIWGNSDLKLLSEKKIEISRRRSFEEVKEKEKEIDLLVCLANNAGHQIPGKLYQYLGTNKPILFILDGEYRDEYISIFSKYNNINFCDNTESSILKTIRKIDLQELYDPIEEFYGINTIKKVHEYLESEI